MFASGLAQPCRQLWTPVMNTTGAGCEGLEASHSAQLRTNPDRLDSTPQNDAFKEASREALIHGLARSAGPKRLPCRLTGRPLPELLTQVRASAGAAHH